MSTPSFRPPPLAPFRSSACPYCRQACPHRRFWSIGLALPVSSCSPCSSPIKNRCASVMVRGSAWLSSPYSMPARPSASSRLSLPSQRRGHHPRFLLSRVHRPHRNSLLPSSPPRRHSHGVAAGHRGCGAAFGSHNGRDAHGGDCRRSARTALGTFLCHLYGALSAHALGPLRQSQTQRAHLFHGHAAAHALFHLHHRRSLPHPSTHHPASSAVARSCAHSHQQRDARDGVEAHRQHHRGHFRRIRAPHGHAHRHLRVWRIPHVVRHVGLRAGDSRRLYPHQIQVTSAFRHPLPFLRSAVGNSRRCQPNWGRAVGNSRR